MTSVVSGTIDLVGTGSTTLNVEPRGAERDASYHVSERAARARREAPEDEDVLLPPDIAVEIDITRLRADDLRREAGPEIDRSERLHGLPIAELDRFLERRRDVSHALLQDEWQQWLRGHRPA